jgi:hypothetical protein
VPQTKTRIYQIYFDPKQLAGLDPDFIPYDNSRDPTPEMREFAVFRKEFLAGTTQSGLTGYLSWKFGRKTGLKGRKFLDFVERNPGFDVYFVNPFPMQISAGNVWEQGERWHPGIVDLANSIFDRLGYGLNVRDLPATLRTSAFCNYWVGSPTFWDKYMSFCLPIFDFIMNEMPESQRALVFSKAESSYGAPYFAYLFERLFTTFLTANRETKSLPYEFSEVELKTLGYSRHEIGLLQEIRKLEMSFPDKRDPKAESATLVSALRAYDRWRFQRRPVRDFALAAGSFFWRLLLKSPKLRQLADATLNRLHPARVENRR